MAKVDPANCVACGRCVEFCPAGAVRLGQKLCKKDGTQVRYPKHEIPWNKKWSQGDWDWDYRDHNRVESHRTGIEVGKDITLNELRARGYKAFYIAIGCRGGRRIGVPGEDAAGVTTAVDYLREINAKETYDIRGDVVVVGGGNVAIDCARDSVRVGAPKVSMLCLETRDIMPASDEEVEEAEADGVAISCGWGPKEILTDTDGSVSGIVFRKCLSVKDASGRFNPSYDDNDTITIPCRHV